MVIPELPEVETIVRDLRPHMIGRMITSLILRMKALNHLLQTDSEQFYQGIMNATVVAVLRKGKYIIFPLSNNNVLVIHLGMTGRLLIQESLDIDFINQLMVDDYIDKHTHMLIKLIDPLGELEDIELHFNDVRLFGNIWLMKNVQNIEKLNIPGLKDLGRDALGILLNEFEQIMCNKRAIKAVLLDQSKVAGVGNIYADEACFAAGIHPTTKGSSLTEEQLLKLWFSVKSVLKQGIKYKGSSTSDYTTTNGNRGSFQDYHRVYRKTGQKCVECGTIIERIKIVGRSTHFCPSCQPEGTK